MTRALLAATVFLPLLGGCATDPTTGGAIFTGGMSQQEEIRVGRLHHPAILKRYGGEYGAPELNRYVESLGQFLASTAERPDLKFKFTVLNSEDVNAFATPGGYVYVTRGLMALADDEAQLAAVLAHEIGHIAARHHAQRRGQTLVANIGLGALGALGGGAAADLGQFAALGILRGFSREHEREADSLSLRYMTRAGFDPGAMAEFLRKLRANARLTKTLRGESPDSVDRFDYFATHPAPAERMERAAEMARNAAVRDPVTGRDVYLSKISGMLYGGDPEQGFVRGRDFLHPKLRFAFRVPPGFSVLNSRTAVAAFGPDGARLVFDRAPKPSDGPMTFYLGEVWGRNLRLENLETIEANGLEAATAAARRRVEGKDYDLRLVAYRAAPGTIYRFLFLIPPGAPGSLSTELRRTTYSFRLLSAAEAARLKPHRLRVVTVAPGETVESLARGLPYADHQVERFEILNGVSRAERLRPGRRLKTVSE